MQARIVKPLRSWKGCAAAVGALVVAAASAHGQTGSESSVGYVDSAVPRNQFRLRYDSAVDDNRPERADFFYSKNALGPIPEKRVNFQQLNSYLELAPLPWLSGFIEMPYVWLQPQINRHQRGLGDLKCGFKAALVNEEDTVLTFQCRLYTPTADGLRGLGTHNWNVEPALLFYQRLTDELTFESELRDFIPVSAADDFAGNVLRYGVGLSYLVYNQTRFRITPVTEVVGWTVLSGKDANDAGVTISAAGQTIVNAKFGVRFHFGEQSDPGGFGNSDLYIGYGRALTGDVWYKDIFRVEFRVRF